MEHETDAVIVGAGPVGLFAVFELGMLRIRAHVVDSLEAIGGQCTALYPEKPIYDIPGFPRVDAGDLVARLEEQAAPFSPVYHLDQRVEALTELEDGWRVETAKGTAIRCKAVIVAAGVGAFGPNRPPLEGLADYEGRSVFYAVRRREDFRGKRVVIGGGGDSAVDWALSLSEVAASVAVVHRRPKFRAAPESVARMKALEAEGKLECVIPYHLDGLEGGDGRLEAVRVKTLKGESRRLEADVLLPFYGLAMNLGPIAEWGLGLDRNHIVVDPSTSMTDRDGIYAVGDIAAYKGKLKLILPKLYRDLRILLGWAWTYLIVAELIGASSGISYFINQQAKYRNYDNVFAAIAMIGIIGLTTDQVLGLIERFLFPWERGSRGLSPS